MMAEKEIIQMTGRDLKRFHLIRKILDKAVKQIEVAKLLGLSERQIRQLVNRVRKEGDRGIIHKSRGHSSNRRIHETVRKKILNLHHSRYSDFGPTLASEKLWEYHRIRVHTETLRLWFKTDSIPYKTRKKKAHHKWRERKAHLGEMVQMDGSHHDWLEGRGPRLVLLAYIGRCHESCLWSLL